MKGLKQIQWCSAAILALSLTACQVKRPKDVLPDAKMESVLYDYHIAKAMGEEVPYNESYKRLLYIESVFEKHNITQAKFDSSIVWFSRNPETLSKIYEKVNQRLKAEKEGLNHLIALRDNKPKESLPGDSIDVWIWQRIYRLTGMPLDNKVAFTLPADTNFSERDTLRWSVRFRFLQGVPDSIHAPLMAMQVLFENDSLIGDIKKVREAGVETISLVGDTLGKIKEVRGFIYYPMQDSTKSILTDRILLMRYHATDTLGVVPKDTLRSETDDLKKDSIHKEPQQLKKTTDNLDSVTHRQTLRSRPSLRNVEKRK